MVAAVTRDMTRIGATQIKVLNDTSIENSGMNSEIMQVTGATLNAVTAMPARIAPGHGACPGCGLLG